MCWNTPIMWRLVYFDRIKLFFKKVATVWMYIFKPFKCASPNTMFNFKNLENFISGVRVHMHWELHYGHELLNNRVAF